MMEFRRALAGLATAVTLFAGCVTENAGPQRTAMWKSHGDGRETNWLGHEKKAPPKLYVAEARLAEDAGDHETARRSYQAALGSDPRSVDAIMGLARLDSLSGRTEEAEKGYTKALRMRPKDPGALDAMGQFYASQKRWPEAIRHLNAATAETPNDSKKRYHLAIAMAMSGDVEGSLPHFAKSCGDAEAHHNVALILKEKGDLVGAEKHLLAAVVKRPDLAQAQALLDEVQHLQGRERILPASQEQPRKERRMTLPVDGPVAGDEQPFGAPPRAVIGPRPPHPAAQAAGTTEFGNEPPQWNAGDSNAAADGAGAPNRSITEPEPYRAN